MPNITGSPTQAATEVQNLSELEVLNTTPLTTGDMASVLVGANGKPQLYVFDRTSTAIPDGDQIISALGGRWINLVTWTSLNAGMYTGTGPLALNQVVYIDAANDVALADASNPAKMPAIGFIAGIDLVAPRPYRVQYSEELTGFIGLTPGANYYVSAAVPGVITTVPPIGNIVQSVGVARNATTLIVNLESFSSGATPANTGTYTSGVLLSLRDLVYVSATDDVARADASNSAKMPAIGLVVAIDLATARPYTVQFTGEVGGFSGLTPGFAYYASDTTPGAITHAIGLIDQVVGIAKDATTLILGSVGSTYQDQTAWSINSNVNGLLPAGNDANVGNAGAPLASLKQLARRLARARTTQAAAPIYTVGLVDAIPATDAFVWYPNENSIPPPTEALVNYAGNLVLAISGVQAQFGSVGGIVGAASNAVPATNTPPKLTDGAVVTWTPLVGRTVLAATGEQATILKDLGAGVAEMGPWEKVSTGATTPPAPGVAYIVLDETHVSCPVAIGGRHITATFSFCTFDQVNPIRCSNKGEAVNFVGCRFTTVNSLALFMLSFADSGNTAMAACCIGSTTPLTVSVNSGFTQMTLCALLNVSVSSLRNSILEVNQCVGEASNLTNYTSGARYPGRLLLSLVGLFNFSDTGLNITLGGVVVGFLNIYGSSAVAASTGTFVGTGGKFILSSNAGAFVPTLTAITELKVDTGVNVIPPLVAGAVVPAAAPLTTWAQFSAAPFNKQWVDQLKGSLIAQE